MQTVTQSQIQPIKKQRKKRVDIDQTIQEKLVKTIEENPNLSQQDIANITGLERSTISKFITKHNITKDEIDEFKKHEADLLTSLRFRLYKSITDADIEKSPMGSRILAYCQIYDKYRLETGQSTDNQSILVSAISDLRRRKVLRNGEHPGETIDVSE